jgi:secreted PhoX family phosphatase
MEVAPTTTFYDIFEAEEPVDGACPTEGFTIINTTPGLECLMVKEGMETLAAFFETRRYAAMLGCTTEGSKWEGITFSPGRQQLYTAMSEVRYGMEDNARKGTPNDQYDIGTNNDMKLAYNYCGCVYYLDVDADMTPINMVALVCGITEPADENNSCALDGIANPDNVAFIEEYDTLIIGEDTGSGHQNDVIFAYDMKTAEMTRIFSTPYGAETTSPWWYNEIKGFRYFMAVVQHPYGESDKDKVNDPESTGLGGWVGTFTPIRASNPQLRMDSNLDGEVNIMDILDTISCVLSTSFCM